MMSLPLGKVGQSLGKLHGWLATVKQADGYAGPVAHWWRNSLLYTGPAIDWRYEGILDGYGTLFRKTGDERWLLCVQEAVGHVVRGQRNGGGYGISSFERNPESMGTPHEAAATLGLLHVVDLLEDQAEVMEAARRNLQFLVDALWDPSSKGFNDRPGIPGRVPNKLATLAEALMVYSRLSEDDTFLPYALSALQDVVRYVVRSGPIRGAVHQYAPGGRDGDGRFFPFYAARCVPALMQGASVFGRQEFSDAIVDITAFLEGSRGDAASWPQIVYSNGRRAEDPRWLAGAAEILNALRLGGDEGDAWTSSLQRLLDSQLPSGGFPTAEGFRNMRRFPLSSMGRRTVDEAPDWLDILPVVGWNDKVFRMLAHLLPEAEAVPEMVLDHTDILVRFNGLTARYQEDALKISVTSGARELYRWSKSSAWAQTGFRVPSL